MEEFQIILKIKENYAFQKKIKDSEKSQLKTKIKKFQKK